MQNSQDFQIHENCDYIVTVASWEERFLLGTKRLLENCKAKTLLMSYCEEYEKLSAPNRERVKDFCLANNVTVFENPLSFNKPKDSWLSIKDLLNNIQSQNTIVDITTMPRETIWATLLFLRTKNCKIHYIYNEPHSYNKQWLSREPDKPRIVFKLGGVYKFGERTKLVIISGYDIDRISHLISFYEPDFTLLGLQLGNQFENEKNNIEKCIKEFGNKKDIRIFYLNAFDTNHGFDVLDQEIKDIASNNNIILSSLGPKLSAISLFNLHEKYPDTALSYAPSKKFNPEYSHGIGNFYIGTMI